MGLRDSFLAVGGIFFTAFVMSLGLRKLAAANSYKAVLRSTYVAWGETVVELDSQVAAIARGVSGCAASNCWISGVELGRLLRARSLSRALLSAIAEGLAAVDTDTLVGVQGRLAELALNLFSLVQEV